MENKILGKIFPYILIVSTLILIFCVFLSLSLIEIQEKLNWRDEKIMTKNIIISISLGCLHFIWWLIFYKLKKKKKIRLLATTYLQKCG